MRPRQEVLEAEAPAAEDREEQLQLARERVLELEGREKRARLRHLKIEKKLGLARARLAELGG